MRPREWGISALVVAVLAWAVAEAAWRLDDWPASRVAMFSGHIGPATPVRRIRLVGRNHRGDVVEVRSVDVGLTPVEFGRRLPPAANLLAESCGALGRLYNERRRFQVFRLARLQADIEMVGRPGMPPPVPAAWTVDCHLER